MCRRPRFRWSHPRSIYHAPKFTASSLSTMISAARPPAAMCGVEIEIVRTGSRGLYWLEPMVEVATPKGRVAFGPVTEFDANSVLDAMLSDPWLKRQTRLTFARCGVIDPRALGDYRAHD